MSTFTKPFLGVKAGEIYPTKFEVGADCPAELESAARAVGSIGGAAPSTELTPAQKFVDGNAADVIASIDGVTSAADLTEARAAEAAGKNRSTVLAALDAAVTKLNGEQG